MGHYCIRAKVRRRKVANLAANSRVYSVRNCTIPKTDKDNLIEKEVKWGKITVVKGTAGWNIPKEGYPQPRTLRKKYKKKYYYKDGRVRQIISHPSDYNQFPDHTFRRKGKAWFMEQVVQHKIAKWEKKNPCPIKKDDSPDMFEEEFIVPWKAARDLAIERIRDFVVSAYDKLPLTGRFKVKKEGMAVYQHKVIAELKDHSGEGHKINELKPNKSKLLKKAQKVTDQVHAKNPNLVWTNLRDHKRQKGRLILPKAA